jgi:hypothetical protein
MMFAATGHTAKTGSLKSKIYYDSQKLALTAVRNFVFDPTWMQPDDRVIELKTHRFSVSSGSLVLRHIAERHFNAL